MLNEKSVESYQEFYDFLQKHLVLLNFICEELQSAANYVPPSEYTHDLSEEVSIWGMGNFIAMDADEDGEIDEGVDPKTGDREIKLTIGEFMNTIMWMIPLMYTTIDENHFSIYEEQVPKLTKRLVAIHAIRTYGN